MANFFKLRVIPKLKEWGNIFADTMCFSVYFPKFVKWLIITNIMTLFVFCAGIYEKTHTIPQSLFYGTLIIFGLVVFNMTRVLILYYIEDWSENKEERELKGEKKEKKKEKTVR